ncbi:sugar O-acetyltransferase [Pseudanabaena sp. FACHB-2040]|uniref:sugar O-acetyltransferase n=1 Tax=Pseudanabaena sp. FACHB-2040 TaxID=2692859 RepID=UPI0016883DF3|nr:sugar O-acetyltransferase [Pseudanabaena sp. FACHB-2040]MBD2257769.1 sugar O-acetyltransferase [Pseudanabaena sp. FACHB-2040]
MADTERDKMLRGDLYLGGDLELVVGRNRARRLWQQYNATDPEAKSQRTELLTTLLGSLGTDVLVEPPFYCDYGTQITLEDGVYINMNNVFLDCASIHIGAQTYLATNVQLLTATHPLNAAERTAGPESARPITIGSRCWLGGGVIVCPGVTIGEDTTIGAGSVVVKDIPAGVLAVGNPCRVVREV